MSLDTDPGDQLLPAAADLPPYGDDHAPDAAAPRRRVPRKRPSQRRFWLRRVAVLTLLLAFAGTGWLAVSAVIARRALLRAQAGTALLRHDLTTGDVTAAAARLAAVHRDAHRAHVLTTSVVWRIAGRVPVAGETPRTVRGLAYEADVLSARVLPHFVTIARTASGGGLRNGDRIDVGALRTMNAELTTLSAELDGVVRRTQALPSRSLLTPVAAGRQQLITDTSALARTVAQLRDATSIAPGMLGADGPRRYFVALETNAELRGSGGLIGAYAVMEVDNGQIRLTQLGSNKELRDTYPQPTPGLDPGFSAQYERFGADGFWLNSNMSADFPTVNRIWSSMYERTTGQHVDGSIAVDPIALAQILKATGPATTPSGESVGADNIVPLTEQQIYARFPAFAQDAVRNDLQLQIARSLYGRLVAPVSHDVGLLPQLGAAAASGHIRIASNHPGEQAVLVRGAVGGALPATDGPYLQVAVNNAGGTKLD
ncbi:MAG: hypothetical protein QOG49_93, partial [Frankiaceae bacterium]|nr:hypothetical protein [Frankiaceae bacterium]